MEDPALRRPFVYKLYSFDDFGIMYIIIFILLMATAYWLLEGVIFSSTVGLFNSYYNSSLVKDSNTYVYEGRSKSKYDGCEKCSAHDFTLRTLIPRSSDLCTAAMRL